MTIPGKPARLRTQLYSAMYLPLIMFTILETTYSGLSCSLPDGSIWSDENQPVTIQWDVNEGICDTIAECYNVNTTSVIETYLQLKPVAIQLGTSLRFIGVNSTEPVSIQPYLVDRSRFLSCDTTSGGHIVEKPTIRYIDIPSESLRIGSNYFIANTDDYFRCEDGFRVNITVKDHHCVRPGSTELCQGHGFCFTSYHKESYQCHCCHGYMGQYCERGDNCTSSKCQNGGTCMNDDNGYHCHCKTGYFGKVCEDIAEYRCASNLCKNGAHCIDEDKHVRCLCQPGYSGRYCEIDINECASNPCHHGICIDKANGFQCYCIPGYGGELCKEDYNECASNPCHNAATCIDLLNRYVCQCGPGHTGHNCEIKVNLCRAHTCVKNSTCIDIGDRYECRCPPGYEGENCQTDIDECMSRPCQNEAKCIDIINGYVCECTSGFSGTFCENEANQPMDGGLNDRELRHAHLHYNHFFGTHIRNLYILLGTLGGAIFIVFFTLVGCYCHVHKTYEIFSWNRLKYKKCDSDRQQFAFDISSGCGSHCHSIDNSCCDTMYSDFEPLPGPSRIRSSMPLPFLADDIQSNIQPRI